MRPMKLGIVGKGGVGKTTVSGLLARSYAARGRRVVAVDTDSNPNLGLSLGLTQEQTEAVPPLPRNVMRGGAGAEDARELLAAYGRVTPAGPTLLSAIKVAEAGAGCTCGGHATVRGLLAETLTDVDVTLVDMEAGLEHLSRSGGTLAYADVLLAVCEPTRKSVMTAARTAALAAELAIPHVLAVGNKARGPQDVEFFSSALVAAGLPLVGVLPHDADVSAADMAGTAGLVPVSDAVREALDEVVAAVADAVRREVRTDDARADPALFTGHAG
jgi:CO dehydrogenase maturation factor